jgi:hypothetical protein
MAGGSTRSNCATNQNSNGSANKATNEHAASRPAALLNRISAIVS